MNVLKNTFQISITPHPLPTEPHQDHKQKTYSYRHLLNLLHHEARGELASVKDTKLRHVDCFHKFFDRRAQHWLSYRERGVRNDDVNMSKVGENLTTMKSVYYILVTPGAIRISDVIKRKVFPYQHKQNKKNLIIKPANSAEYTTSSCPIHNVGEAQSTSLEAYSNQCFIKWRPKMRPRATWTKSGRKQRPNHRKRIKHTRVHTSEYMASICSRFETSALYIFTLRPRARIFCSISLVDVSSTYITHTLTCWGKMLFIVTVHQSNFSWCASVLVRYFAR